MWEGIAQNGRLGPFVELRFGENWQKRGGVFKGGVDTPMHTIW